MNDLCFIILKNFAEHGQISIMFMFNKLGHFSMAMHDVLFSMYIHIIFLRNENKHIDS